MDGKIKRRSFLKNSLSFMAFGAGSLASFSRKRGAAPVSFGPEAAHAANGIDRKMKKIGVEEHFQKKGYSSIDSRLRDMDEAGIDMQVLSATLMPNTAYTVAEARAWAVEINDIMAKVIEKHPDRFSAFAAVSLLEPKEAALELERAVTQLGFKGALIGAEKRTFLDDPEYGIFLETAERLDVPIYMHPKVPAEDMIGPYLKYPILSRSMWGFAAEAGLHAMRLILGGVFETYPKLQIILGHLGENIPYQLWRLDNRWKNEKDGMPGMFPADPSAALMKKLPSEYFKQHFYVSTSGMFWEPALQLAIQAMGIDRVLFAVDYNAEKNTEAVEFMKSVNLSREDKAKIYHGNAERLLKL
jgi:predicted TIM-barrel fold metal-dependent hydrolase